MPVPSCVSCAHYEQASCAHPHVAVDLVTGGKRLRDAYHMREADGPCGPEGRLWQSRGVPMPGAPERSAPQGDTHPERPVMQRGDTLPG